VEVGTREKTTVSADSSTVYISTKVWPIKALLTLVLTLVHRYNGQLSNRIWLRVPDANDDSSVEGVLVSHARHDG
jgi:hypothetical protein